MNEREAIQYIEENGKWGVCLGLDTVRTLLNYLGDPQKDLKFIHIAGTNGKGSISTMTAAVLTEAGYRTGLFTSPALTCFNERIQMNGKPIDGSSLAECTGTVKDAVARMTADGHNHPSGFEIETAIAFTYFKNCGADICVIEVGMGGRLDATNVIPAPLIAVIAHISLDHTDYLGNTIAEIAGEKAGIIKKGSSAVVMAPQSAEAAEVIKNKADAVGVPLTAAERGDLTIVSADIDGQVMKCEREIVPGLSTFTLRLLGGHQRDNTVTVLNVIALLIQKGWKISAADIEKALSSVTFPGRFELLSRDPLLLIDGAHNPDGITVFSKNLKTYFPNTEIHLYFGMLADKDIRSSLDLLLPLADRITVMAPLNDRAMPADQMAELIKKEYGRSVDIAESPEDAVKEIAEERKGVLNAVTGSLYLIGFVRAAWIRENSLPEASEQN